MSLHSSAWLPPLLCLAGLLPAAIPSPAAAQGRSEFEAARRRMVDEEIVAAGVSNERVIRAMRETPRHEFVPLNQRPYAYWDMALPIGEGQTISPPFVVASMTEALDPQPRDKVLEIGTGSGYQAAVLSPLVAEVYTIEIVPSLGRRAAAALRRLRYDNVRVKIGDGFEGWPEHAPFDKIIVTCSPEKVPPALAAQLREGGRMVIPVGERYQQTLYVMTKRDGRLVGEALKPTLFVPMTGQAERGREVQPDPTRPAVVNGGFEHLEGDPPQAAGWHYQRQMTVVSSAQGDAAPEGDHYARFRNTVPGRGCQALQGFPVDGRRVPRLELSFHVRGQDIRPGQHSQQLPVVGITFYDENRATVGQWVVGPWRATFPWRAERALIDVPPRAREAIMRIGLLGAIGEIDFDGFELKPSP
jgi:protein-L-isoaspartate(D-aspartate) O-methyltransferase